MIYPFCRRLLFALQPETAHRLVMANLDWAVHMGLHKYLTHTPDEDPVTVMGLRFPNAVGLAAGTDTDGRRVSALGALGFGHVEVGTVTPRPQAGTDKPRLFRVPGAQAIINRMGTPSAGAAAVKKNLSSADAFRLRGGIVGVNLGKNAATPVENALADYLRGLEMFYGSADYVTVNISSPDMAGIRQLEEDGRLGSFLGALTARRDELVAEHGRRLPVAVKLSPDTDNSRLPYLLDTLMENGVDGIIAVNAATDDTIRTKLQGNPHSLETGAVSGAPLRARATEVVRLISEHTAGKLPVIASGGILTPEDAVEKVEAGASLVQLCTGLIYTGPELIADTVEAIHKRRQSLTEKTE